MNNLSLRGRMWRKLKMTVKWKGRQVKVFVVVIKKLLFGNLALFLLPNKTEWA